MWSSRGGAPGLEQMVQCNPDLGNFCPLTQLFWVRGNRTVERAINAAKCPSAPILLDHWNYENFLSRNNVLVNVDRHVNNDDHECRTLRSAVRYMSGIMSPAQYCLSILNLHSACLWSASSPRRSVSGRVE